MRAPRSTRGASRGVLECGSGAVVATGCNTHTRAATAEAARSRRASRAPPGALGGMSYRRCQPPRHAEAAEAVERLPRRKDGGLKGQSTGGRAEQASNIARGTLENERTCGRSNCRCLVAARRSGPWVRQDPGVPRRPHLFGGAPAQTSGAKHAARRRTHVWTLEITRWAREACSNTLPWRPSRGG